MLISEDLQKQLNNNDKAALDQNDTRPALDLSNWSLPKWSQLSTNNDRMIYTFKTLTQQPFPEFFKMVIHYLSVIDIIHFSQSQDFYLAQASDQETQLRLHGVILQNSERWKLSAVQKSHLNSPHFTYRLHRFPPLKPLEQISSIVPKEKTEESALVATTAASKSITSLAVAATTTTIPIVEAVITSSEISINSRAQNKKFDQELQSIFEPITPGVERPEVVSILQSIHSTRNEAMGEARYLNFEEAQANEPNPIHFHYGISGHKAIAAGYQPNEVRYPWFQEAHYQFLRQGVEREIYILEIANAEVEYRETLPKIVVLETAIRILKVQKEKIEQNLVPQPLTEKTLANASEINQTQDKQKSGKLELEKIKFELNQKETTLQGLQSKLTKTKESHQLFCKRLIEFHWIAGYPATKGLILGYKNIRGMTPHQVQFLLFGIAESLIRGMDNYCSNALLLLIPKLHEQQRDRATIQKAFEEYMQYSEVQLEGLVLGFTTIDIKQSWFSGIHIMAVSSGISLEQVRDKSGNEVIRELILMLGNVSKEELSTYQGPLYERHIEAMRRGFSFEEIRDLNEVEFALVVDHAVDHKKIREIKIKHPEILSRLHVAAMQVGIAFEDICRLNENELVARYLKKRLKYIQCAFEKSDNDYHDYTRCAALFAYCGNSIASHNTTVHYVNAAVRVGLQAQRIAAESEAQKKQKNKDSEVKETLDVKVAAEKAAEARPIRERRIRRAKRSQARSTAAVAAENNTTQPTAHFTFLGFSSAATTVASAAAADTHSANTGTTASISSSTAANTAAGTTATLSSSSVTSTTTAPSF